MRNKEGHFHVLLLLRGEINDCPCCSIKMNGSIRFGTLLFPQHQLLLPGQWVNERPNGNYYQVNGLRRSIENRWKNNLIDPLERPSQSKQAYSPLTHSPAQEFHLKVGRSNRHKPIIASSSSASSLACLWLLNGGHASSCNFIFRPQEMEMMMVLIWGNKIPSILLLLRCFNSVRIVKYVESSRAFLTWSTNPLKYSILESSTEENWKGRRNGSNLNVILFY